MALKASNFNRGSEWQMWQKKMRFRLGVDGLVDCIDYQSIQSAPSKPSPERRYKALEVIYSGLPQTMADIFICFSADEPQPHLLWLALEDLFDRSREGIPRKYRWVELSGLELTNIVGLQAYCNKFKWWDFLDEGTFCEVIESPDGGATLNKIVTNFFVAGLGSSFRNFVKNHALDKFEIKDSTFTNAAAHKIYIGCLVEALKETEEYRKAILEEYVRL